VVAGFTSSQLSTHDEQHNMTFPERIRVIYDVNPLVEVICQLRFPPILRVAAEPPVAFQERIRAQYPLYSQRDPVQTMTGIPPELARLLGSTPFAGVPGTHDFSSVDSMWTVSLSRDSLALTCTDYVRWEYFADHLGEPLKALHEIYKPAFYTRIGLRYRDVICRGPLKLPDTPWMELLSPSIAADLGDSSVADRVEKSIHNVVFKVDEHDGKVQIQHGLTPNPNGTEMCYLIDSDFYREQQTETKNAPRVLDAFNEEAGRLFRWCITSKLHDAMGPKPIAPS
jgi:uncharacterized protein (TIGR04255 family)